MHSYISAFKKKRPINLSTDDMGSQIYPYIFSKLDSLTLINLVLLYAAYSQVTASSSVDTRALFTDPLIAKLQPIHFQMRLLISSAPSDLNVKLLGSLIYEEEYKVS